MPLLNTYPEFRLLNNYIDSEQPNLINNVIPVSIGIVLYITQTWFFIMSDSYAAFSLAMLCLIIPISDTVDFGLYEVI